LEIVVVVDVIGPRVVVRGASDEPDRCAVFVEAEFASKRPGGVGDIEPRDHVALIVEDRDGGHHDEDNAQYRTDDVGEQDLGAEAIQPRHLHKAHSPDLSR
jgi:hypothetical protein